MIIKQNKIEQFIPQRKPFIMIDELSKADEKGFISKFNIRDNNIFLKNNIVSESALVENIAQTCAAGFGYINSIKENEEPKLGFIGAVSKLTVNKKAKIHSSLTTEVQILNTFDNIHLIEGTVFEKNQKLVSCQMKIVIA